MAGFLGLGAVVATALTMVTSTTSSNFTEAPMPQLQERTSIKTSRTLPPCEPTCESEGPSRALVQETSEDVLRGKSSAEKGTGESSDTLKPDTSAEAMLELILSEALSTSPRTLETTAFQPDRAAYARGRNATLEIIAANRYPSEAHSVRTSDGFLLTMYRLVRSGHKPVLLQHGFLSSSADWVVMDRNRSLAFILCDAGYDVWIGNFRGNANSRAHTSMSPSSSAFWDFSWHEKGVHDVPAMIDYVLKTTQQEKLVYVGHSEGATAFLVGASEKPEYNRKVAGFVALAPIAFLENLKSLPMRIISKGLTVSSFIADTLGTFEFTPALSFLNKISKKVCFNANAMLSIACSNTMFLFLGFDADQIVVEKVPAILQNVPSSTSTKTIIHFAQLTSHDAFRQFDYGLIKNLYYYKRLNPPEYQLGKVSTPVYIHYAQNDVLASPEDVGRLKNVLTNVKEYRRIPHRTFNHIDVLFGRDAKRLLYDRVLDNIREAFA